MQQTQCVPDLERENWWLKRPTKKIASKQEGMVVCFIENKRKFSAIYKQRHRWMEYSTDAHCTRSLANSVCEYQ